MKQKSEIKKFIESVLDSSVPVDQQSMICSTELSLIGGKPDGNGTCQNSSDACGTTNISICYNSGSFCNLSNNPGKCINTGTVQPPANADCIPPIVDNQCNG